jgi:DNA end-binding protein Ku
MPQAVWTGDLSFGLVSIPVKLYSATSQKRVRFHQYDASTGQRVRYKRVVDVPPAETEVQDETEMPDQTEPEPLRAAPDPEPVEEPIHHEPIPEPDESGEETEVLWEDIVKGYEVEPGRVVTVDPDELESVAPERSRVLEVEQFVDLQSIDPVHFEKSYHVIPRRDPVAERPYWLLYRAMEEAGKVAVGRFVMRTKEYLVAVRPAEHVLMLETLFYADEVRDPKEVWVPAIAEPSERELQVAHQFLEALAGDWEPTRLRDEHRERLLDLIHRKSGEAVVVQEEETPPAVTPAIDLMEALRASVDAAKEARDQQERETG